MDDGGATRLDAEDGDESGSEPAAMLVVRCREGVDDEARLPVLLRDAACARNGMGGVVVGMFMRADNAAVAVGDAPMGEQPAEATCLKGVDAERGTVRQVEAEAGMAVEPDGEHQSMTPPPLASAATGALFFCVPGAGAGLQLAESRMNLLLPV